jgi:SAM-dependent methyltransferase
MPGAPAGLEDRRVHPSPHDARHVSDGSSRTRARGEAQAWREPVHRPQPAVTLAVPAIARVIDCLVGGKDNFQVDRECAAEALAVDPRAGRVVVEDRRFRLRAVRHLAGECGVNQFIDIGTGLPTTENVHQVAQRHDPEARVVYVDHDPIVVAHGQALLAVNERIAVVQADLRDPSAILGHPEVGRLIDWNRPVGVLLAPVLHFLSDADRPEQVMRTIREALPPGSHIVISHACAEARPQEAEGVMDVYRTVVPSATERDRERIAAFFGDFVLAEPGLTWVPAWRPDGITLGSADRIWHLGGVARKPGPAA